MTDKGGRTSTGSGLICATRSRLLPPFRCSYHAPVTTRLLPRASTGGLFALYSNRQFNASLALSEKLLHDAEVLIHKAVYESRSFHYRKQGNP